LWIDVDEQRLETAPGKSCGQVHRGGRLADPTLLADDREDAPHAMARATATRRIPRLAPSCAGTPRSLSRARSRPVPSVRRAVTPGTAPGATRHPHDRHDAAAGTPIRTAH